MPERSSLVRRGTRAALLCVLALLGGVLSDTAVAGDGPEVVTSTGVVTHGSIESNANTVGWLLMCSYSHSNQDDPIVHPGQPGASHQHDYFGNQSAAAASTYASMTAAPTSCGTAADTAGYWQPSVQVLANGTWTTLVPNQVRQQVYYRARYPSGTLVETIPADLRVTVGNASAATAADNPALASGAIYWECYGTTTVHYQAPPLACSGTDTILENVQMPSCWDGVLTHQNDTAHVTNTPPDAGCPAAFPHALPRISLKVKYQVGHPDAVRLSSGNSYSAHADFWNTWRQPGLDYLVARCINAGISCGTDPIAA